MKILNVLHLSIRKYHLCCVTLNALINEHTIFQNDQFDSEVIQIPVSFNILRQKLTDGAYVIREEFETDIFLIHRNANRFHKDNKEHPLVVESQEMMEKIEELIYLRNLDEADEFECTHSLIQLCLFGGCLQKRSENKL